MFVLLIPGFAAFVIFRKIAAVEQAFSDFETTVWSLFITLAIYSAYGTISGVSSIDDLAAYVSQPIHLGELLVLTVVGTTVTAWVVKVTFRKNIQQGDCWDLLRLKLAEEGAWLIVHTVDGLEYKGSLHSVGWGRSKREIVLSGPRMILRNKKNWRILDEIDCGKQILFTEPDIRRVEFLTDLESNEDTRQMIRVSIPCPRCGTMSKYSHSDSMTHALVYYCASCQISFRSAISQDRTT